MIFQVMRQQLLSMLLLSTVPISAQLLASNAAGVTAGHEVFRFRDLDAATKFWAALGGEPTELGPLKMTKFPGALFLVRQGEPNGPMEGSTIQYFGFKVKSLKESLAKWDMLDIKPMPGGSAKQVFLMGPDGVKVRITEDRSVSTWIVADQIKMVVPDVAAAEAWYAKWFGAKLVKDGQELVGDMPGSNILFAKADGPVTGTKGRVMDRIGIEVKDVEKFCRDVEASGYKLDSPYRKAPAANLNLAVCVLTDPWGTYIEVSQGLNAAK
jgi:catechol 2,3-dioxygenase-like lactoylglutathione lyase family enzyme